MSKHILAPDDDLHGIIPAQPGFSDRPASID